MDRPTNPLAGLAPGDVDREWSTRYLDRLTDAELLRHAAELLAVPRRSPADSFRLHAPLELMARSALLQAVPQDARDAARRRIAWVAATWEQADEPLDDPPAPAPGDPVDALVEALDQGDLDSADAAVVALCGRSTPLELTDALTDPVLPRLAAAAHGPIFLDQLTRFRPRVRSAGLMARGLVRELARRPGWVLHWIDEPTGGGSEVPAGDLFELLLAPPAAGDPGSASIYPTMSLVDRTGLAGQVLGATVPVVDVAAARRQLLRVAAWSMLQDDPAHAPYGWTHCLTMPQAVLALAHRSAEPRRAVAVAATYVLGFRSTLSSVALDPRRPPEPPARAAGQDWLDSGPGPAAAWMWHAPAGARAGLVGELTAFAATHHDAHVAKYTVACLEATAEDPGAGPLYLAAAASLAGWWRASPDARFDDGQVPGQPAAAVAPG